ncbi:MAG: hypothetical protein CM15mP58_22700 [Burkholderiaceae bacterium]|nr:MAG: hypothetical protein CM15mP58_22700 [Burkholderiaceae bacterium]
MSPSLLAKAILTGIFGKQEYLTQVISSIKKGVIKDIHFAVLQVGNLQEAIAITFPCTHYSLKAIKGNTSPAFYLDNFSLILSKY